MFLPNPGIMAAGGQVAPPGQRLFTASDSFIVPDGVTSICVVAIGRGENAQVADGYSKSGRGGELVWVNSIPTTPGEALSVQITASHSRLRRGTTNLVIALSGETYSTRLGGGGSGSAWVFELSRPGGGAGGYTGRGQDAPSISSYAGGGGTSPYGGGPGASAGAEPSGTGGVYGGGGGLRSPNFTMQGGPGCVRIMWGEGRAFPNTNTGDL